MFKKPGKKTLAKFGIGGATAAVLLAGLITAGYTQAKQAAGQLGEKTSDSTELIRQQITQATKKVNNSGTKNSDAITTLSQLAQKAGEQTGICSEVSKPMASFLHGDYTAAAENCRQQEYAAANLKVVLDGFVSDARFMVELQNALKPGLGSSSGNADPDKILIAWQQVDKKLAAIKSVPDEAKNPYTDLTDAAKAIIKQAKAVKAAQSNADTAAFKNANKAMAGAYEKLHEAGGSLRNWLIGEQKQLLEAARTF